MEQKRKVLGVEKDFLHESTGGIISNGFSGRHDGLGFINSGISFVQIELVRLVMKST